MRAVLYASAGVVAFTVGGLVIGRSFGDPITIVAGATMGLLVAAIRRSSVSRRAATAATDLCDSCWSGVHTGGIPCPNAECLCARCNPFIGRYAPEDSPSRIRDFDQD